MSLKTTAKRQTHGIDAETNCPECDGATYHDGHEVVCADCGVIVAVDRIDHGPEWRNFEDNPSNPSRVGPPRTETRHDNGLSTKIGRSRGESRATKRRRNWNQQTKMTTKADRALAHGLSEIQRLTSTLERGKAVRDRACRLFRNAQSDSLLRGRAIESMAAAAVAAACREQRVMCPLAEIAERSVADAQTIRRRMLTLASGLNLGLPPFEAPDHVRRLASELDLDDAVIHDAEQLAKRGVDAGVFQGRKPTGGAAACIYESHPTLTQIDVAEAADVTPVTLRSAWNALQDADLC